VLAGRAAALVAASLLAAGCGGQGEQRTGTPPTTEPSKPKKLDPGETLVALLEAVDAGEEGRARSLVTRSSKRGLDLVALGGRARPLAGARIVLSELVDGPWAVAAVVKGTHAFAVPLRREGGAWRVELGDPIALRPVLPHPGGIALSSDPQIAAEAKSRSALLGIALWLDGVDFSVEAGGPRPGYVTVFGRVGHMLAPGLHVVVAFARAGKGATATAWTFRAPQPVA
jgi:hypothetical protein